MQLTRRTSAEVYAFIESDLRCIAALPNKSVYAASEKKSGAAYALLAKVNLTKRSGKSSRQR
jgi:hypothetical protein